MRLLLALPRARDERPRRPHRRRAARRHRRPSPPGRRRRARHARRRRVRSPHAAGSTSTTCASASSRRPRPAPRCSCGCCRSAWPRPLDRPRLRRDAYRCAAAAGADEGTTIVCVAAALVAADLLRFDPSTTAIRVRQSLLEDAPMALLNRLTILDPETEVVEGDADPGRGAPGGAERARVDRARRCRRGAGPSRRGGPRRSRHPHRRPRRRRCRRVRRARGGPARGARRPRWPPPSRRTRAGA